VRPGPLLFQGDLGMGRIIRPITALLLALFMRPEPTSGPASPARPVQAEGDTEWYAPRAEDFRPPYDRDAANRAKQPWEQHWTWVKSFYEGNLFAKGWSDRARWLVEDVRSDVARMRLRTRLNALGREICSEWAKDYDVRKVNSADLLTCGKMLEKAKAGDDGTGAELDRTIDEIVKIHRGKAAGGSASSR
jgi:hypothetical protein